MDPGLPRCEPSTALPAVPHLGSDSRCGPQEPCSASDRPVDLDVKNWTVVSGFRNARTWSIGRQKYGRYASSSTVTHTAPYPNAIPSTPYDVVRSLPCFQSRPWPGRCTWIDETSPVASEIRWRSPSREFVTQTN